MRKNPQTQTTINITKVLRNRLRDMRKGPDTYETIIWRLIGIAENPEKTGIPGLIVTLEREGG